MAGAFKFPRGEDDYAALPALIPKGTTPAERDAIIREIVEAWSKPLPADEVKGADFGGVTLNRVRLWDDERDEAIDLGALVAAIEPTGRTEEIISVALRGCVISACRCDSLRMPDHFNVSACLFGQRAYFGGATFGDRAQFGGATFGDEAYFGGATFGDGAQFGATFGDGADFDGATFGDGARFVAATFGEGARFGATFGDDAWYVTATFGDRATFSAATFGDRAWFEGATFGDEGWFGAATFGDGARFGGATFGDGAYFERATFGDGAWFGGATFGDGAQLADLTSPGIDFHEVTLPASVVLNSLSSRGHARLVFERQDTRVNRFTRGFGWSTVRAINELRVLTLASYVSLLVVPIIAGAWTAVAAFSTGSYRLTDQSQAMIDSAADTAETALAEAVELNGMPNDLIGPLEVLRRDVAALSTASNDLLDDLKEVSLARRTMPWVWGFGYAAALMVAAGHLVYQLYCPALIKEERLDEHMRAARDGFDDDAADNRDRTIDRALEALEEVAIRNPSDRNRNLVINRNRVRFIPSVVDHFWDDPEPSNEDLPGNRPADAPPRRGDPKLSLMRLAVEEGARAMYDLESWQKKTQAWICAGFYWAAGLFILVVVALQVVTILDAMGG